MIRSLALSAMLLVGSTEGLSAQIAYDGPFLDRAGKYDAYPSHLFIDGVHHLWFCGFSTNGPDGVIDGIFYTFKTGNLGAGGWSTPVEVFNRTTSPWAEHHVCDPSVVLGDFLYNGLHYRFALYYTADDNSSPFGVNNQIGLAFSNDGTTWVAHPTPVLTTTNAFNATYGVGASGTAWSEGTPVLNHFYNDTTVAGPFPVVRKSSADGLTYTPAVALSTLFDEAGRANYGSTPDLAFSPLEGVWYGTLSNADSDGTGLGEVRVIRSTGSSVSDSWEVVHIIDQSVTGEEVQHNAGLAKNGDSTLHVDSAGWAYLLISTGDDFPDFQSWKLGQIRFRVQPGASNWLGDDFAATGPLTQDGRLLDGTESLIGGRSWNASNVAFSAGSASVTAAGAIGIATLAYQSLSSATVSSVEAHVSSVGAGWAGIGFLGPAGPGLATDGQLWMFQQGGEVRVRASGTSILLFSGIPPVLHSGSNLLRLEYRHVANTVSAFVNGIPLIQDIALSSFGFTPSLQGATLQIHQGTPGQSTVDLFRVNSGGSLIFSDGFETGSTDRWQVGEATINRP
jgi:hypothetical protein